MRQLFEDPADEAAARAERLTESATRQFLNSLTSKKGTRMRSKKTKPAATEAANEPEPAKPVALTITFGEVARLLGVAVNELEGWARRGLLPLAFNGDTHPHHWTWSRDAMTRWCDAMKSDMAKAQRSRLA